MNKNEIKKSLIALGYHISDRENGLFGGVKGKMSLEEGIVVINSGFNILFENNQAIVLMANAIINKKASFDSKDDLIKFLKENAPIN